MARTGQGAARSGQMQAAPLNSRRGASLAVAARLAPFFWPPVSAQRAGALRPGAREQPATVHNPEGLRFLRTRILSSVINEHRYTA